MTESPATTCAGGRCRIEELEREHRDAFPTCKVSTFSAKHDHAPKPEPIYVQRCTNRDCCPTSHVQDRPHPIDLAHDTLRAAGMAPAIQHTGGGIAAVAVTLPDGTVSTVWVDDAGDAADDAPSYMVTRHATLAAFWDCQRDCPKDDALPLQSLAEAVGAVDVCAAPEPVHPATIARVTRAGLYAFWQEVAQQFPQVETGDLDPVASARFDATAESIVELWLTTNGATIADGAR